MFSTNEFKKPVIHVQDAAYFDEFDGFDGTSSGVRRKPENLGATAGASHTRGSLKTFVYQLLTGRSRWYPSPPKPLLINKLTRFFLCSDDHLGATPFNRNSSFPRFAQFPKRVNDVLGIVGSYLPVKHVQPCSARFTASGSFSITRSRVCDAPSGSRSPCSHF